jgi:hypothetical protein
MDDLPEVRVRAEVHSPDLTFHAETVFEQPTNDEESDVLISRIVWGLVAGFAHYTPSGVPLSIVVSVDGLIMQSDAREAFENLRPGHPARLALPIFDWRRKAVHAQGRGS